MRVSLAEARKRKVTATGQLVDKNDYAVGTVEYEIEITGVGASVRCRLPLCMLLDILVALPADVSVLLPRSSCIRAFRHAPQVSTALHTALFYCCIVFVRVDVRVAQPSSAQIAPASEQVSCSALCAMR